MADARLRKIAIVGGGMAGWMSAAALARFVPQPCEIELIELATNEAAAAGEATLPSLEVWHRMLGIDESDFMRHTRATFKLGIELQDWATRGATFFHPFGMYGAGMDPVVFHNVWSKLRLNGDQASLEDFSLHAVAARRGRFARPAAGDRSIIAGLSYGYHLDVERYGSYLRRFAERRGVKRIAATVRAVRLREQDGFIESIELSDGSQVQADLFIDCSGFQALLIEAALHAGYEHESDVLPCDRAVTVACECAGELPPFTRSIAQDAGWQWRIPLQDRIDTGYVYSRAFVSDDEATATLLANLPTRAVSEPRAFSFATGLRKKVWSANCVAIGSAAGYFEPLASTATHLIQTAIARLLACLPDRACDTPVVAEYNRLTRIEYERIRDFLALHYHATQRTDTPFWRACRGRDIPDLLSRKLRMFERCGRVVLLDEETFANPSWVAVFSGFQVLPQRYAVTADRIDFAQAQRHFNEMRQLVDRAANVLPRHAEFVSAYCLAAREPPPGGQR